MKRIFLFLDLCSCVYKCYFNRNQTTNYLQLIKCVILVFVNKVYEWHEFFCLMFLVI